MADPERQEQQRVLKQAYGFQFPPDFFTFHRFHRDHAELIREVDIVFDLVGPFDLLRNPALDGEDIILEFRHYNDPPEFLTIALGQTDGLHWGYYVDDPEKPPFPITDYYSNDAFDISVAGSTLFETLRTIIERHHEDKVTYTRGDLGKLEEFDQLNRLREALQKYETGDRPEVGRRYLDKYGPSKVKRRIDATTRDNIGIVVPWNKYKPLKGEDLFQKWNFSPTAELVEPRAQEAMDLLKEGYPGAALKLGKDLWVYSEFRETCYNLLDAAYSAMNRPLLQKYLKMASSFREKCDSRQSS